MACCQLASALSARVTRGAWWRSTGIRSAEALTSVLIFINKHYQVDGAGVRITGDLKGD